MPPPPRCIMPRFGICGARNTLYSRFEYDFGGLSRMAVQFWIAHLPTTAAIAAVVALCGDITLQSISPYPIYLRWFSPTSRSGSSESMFRSHLPVKTACTCCFVKNRTGSHIFSQQRNAQHKIQFGGGVGLPVSVELMVLWDMTLTAGMLEGAEDGLSLVSCANVDVAEDVPVQLLREKLVGVIACANVRCTVEQLAAIELVAQNSVNIGPRRSRDQSEEDGSQNRVEINAAFYTL